MLNKNCPGNESLTIALTLPYNYSIKMFFNTSFMEMQGEKTFTTTCTLYKLTSAK